MDSDSDDDSDRGDGNADRDAAGVVVKRDDRPSAGGSGGGILFVWNGMRLEEWGWDCRGTIVLDSGGSVASRGRFGVWTLFRWSEGVPRRLVAVAVTGC